MNYWTAAAALVCLCIGVILLLASLGWFVKRQQDRLPMAYLLALVCLIVLQSLEFLYHASGWFRQVPFFLKLADPIIVLIPFCIYGYIRALQGENVLAWKKNRWLHASPMIAVALLAIPFWSLPGELKIHWMLQARTSESLWEPVTLYGNSYLAVIGGLSLTYWWIQHLRGVTTRKPAVREWIGHLQLIQLIIVASMTIRIAIYIAFGESFSVIYVLAPTTAYLTYLLLTHAHPPMHIPREAPLHNGDIPEHLPETSGDEAAVQAERLLFGELTTAMEKDLFRDSSLTLGKLAEQCGTTTHNASAAINLCSGSNFYEWVNGYRIQAACKALSGTDLNVSKICYDVGFNSKSTFNTAFRKLKGCTPTEFRKKHSRHSGCTNPDLSP